MSAENTVTISLDIYHKMKDAYEQIENIPLVYIEDYSSHLGNPRIYYTNNKDFEDLINNRVKEADKAAKHLSEVNSRLVEQIETLEEENERLKHTHSGKYWSFLTRKK